MTKISLDTDLSAVLNVRTPVDRVTAIVYELRDEKKISSADCELILGVILPLAFSEYMEQGNGKRQGYNS